MDGIGDILDPAGNMYHMVPIRQLSRTEIDGMLGHYDRVDARTHIAYETIPAPYVAIKRIAMDMMYTRDPNMDRNWNLPQQLTPQVGAIPNENLLGWRRASNLTSGQ